MDMVLMKPVGAGSEHGGEAGARALAHALAQILGHRRIGELVDLAVRELERADVERIALAVLAQLGAHDAVAATAFVGGEVGVRTRGEPSSTTVGASSSRTQ